MKQYLLPILMSTALVLSARTTDRSEHNPYLIENENRLVQNAQIESGFDTGSPSEFYSVNSLTSLSRLLHRLQERLTTLMNRQNGLASRHHWEYGARIDRNWNGELRWVDLKSSKGTGNATSVRITNRTVVCFHTHPEDSIPQLSYHDRENARQAYRRLCDQCRRRGIPEPAPAWFVTVHASGEMWAWRPGMAVSVPVQGISLS